MKRKITKFKHPPRQKTKVNVAESFSDILKKLENALKTLDNRK